MAAVQEAKDPLSLVEAGDYLSAWQTALTAASSANRPEWASYNLQLVDSFVRGSSPSYRPPFDDTADCESFKQAVHSLSVGPSMPLGKIASAAAKVRVVILNENHFEPRHRAFALQLARALKPVGYDAIGVEALSNLNDAKTAAQNNFSFQDGPVDLRSGILTAEPAFARFLNLSIGAGFRLVAYEYAGDGAGTKSIREEAQATALAKYLRAYPKSKILVYVGYSHVAERPLSDGKGAFELWMAARLRAILRTDVITIDQTFDGYETCPMVSPDADREQGARRPYIIVSGGKLGKYLNVVDFQVLHRPVPVLEGRPAWVASLDLIPAPADHATARQGELSLFQVFTLPRAADAVPVDQILVRRGEPTPALMAPRGPYEIVHQSK